MSGYGQDMVRIWSGYGQDMVRIWSGYGLGLGDVTFPVDRVPDVSRTDRDLLL